MSVCRYTSSHGERGFSLIELVAAVAILGVLLAIAVPFYQEYRVRANRAAAKGVLLEIVSRQEQYAGSNRAYVAAGNTAAVESDLGLDIADDVAANYVFTIDLQDVAAGTDNGFVATATPVAGSMQDGDGVLSINQFGLKLPTDKW